MISKLKNLSKLEKDAGFRDPGRQNQAETSADGAVPADYAVADSGVADSAAADSAADSAAAVFAPADSPAAFSEFAACAGEPVSSLPTSPPPPPPDDPVALYRLVTHVTPNAFQRELLRQEVLDLQRWQGTLEHWLAHRWNKFNLVGMLDMYRRGGVGHCRNCARHGGQGATGSAEAFETLRQRYPGPVAAASVAASDAAASGAAYPGAL